MPCFRYISVPLGLPYCGVILTHWNILTSSKWHSPQLKRILSWITGQSPLSIKLRVTKSVKSNSDYRNPNTLRVLGMRNKKMPRTRKQKSAWSIIQVIEVRLWLIDICRRYNKYLTTKWLSEQEYRHRRSFSLTLIDVVYLWSTLKMLKRWRNS